jgi:hypothetical protein
MKIDIKNFRATAGEKVKLDKWPTQVKPVYKSKKVYKKLLAEQADELFDVIFGFEALKVPAHGMLRPA